MSSPRPPLSDPSHQATIAIYGLRLRALIGVNAHERRRPQPLRIDVECRCDIAAAVSSDALQDTIDYCSIAACIHEVAHARHSALLETLCQRAASTLLARFPAIAAVTMTARKPRALRRADWAGSAGDPDRMTSTQPHDPQENRAAGRATGRAMSQAVASQLDGFPPHYFQSFSTQQLETHARAVEALQAGRSFVLLFAEQRAEVTIIARDYPGVFAILTGLLAAAEFDILAGDSYTSQMRRAEMAYTLRRHARPRRPTTSPQRGIIIDHFRGRLPKVDPARWRADLADQLQGFMELLAQDSETSSVEARRRIIERVSQALRQRHISPTQAMAPVQIEIEQRPYATRLQVLSKNTPFFLYALSVALSFHGVSIIRVEIHTETERIIDLFEIVDRLGRAIHKRDVLNRIRLSILLGKQFTYFLHSAPDPYRALERFELIIQDFLELAERGQLDLLLSSPKVLQDLARLLGASDFLWEDFLQRQYEMVLPILSRQSTTYSLEPDKVAAALQRQLEQTEDYDQQRRVLNDFKDNEIFQIDLDHILSHAGDFLFLSSRLTNIAEIIISAALQLARVRMRSLYGRSRTAAGIEADCSILGLGKLGGQALGYASDIELLMVYSDDGESDGPQQIANSEYFDRLMRETAGFIQAKRDGIFQVDLRLRPHGGAGPMAVSLAGFVQYYRRAAASLEKLALVRMRHIAGKRSLGERIEHIRDEIIYAAIELDMDELLWLRATQRAQSDKHDQLNAKLSPGGLADLEHCVQILQVRFGHDDPDLRTPSIHAALEALAAAGRIDAVEARQLARAYRFLRALINGLRMLRGNARGPAAAGHRVAGVSSLGTAHGLQRDGRPRRRRATLRRFRGPDRRGALFRRAPTGTRAARPPYSAQRRRSDPALRCGYWRWQWCPAAIAQRRFRQSPAGACQSAHNGRRPPAEPPVCRAGHYGLATAYRERRSGHGPEQLGAAVYSTARSQRPLSTLPAPASPTGYIAEHPFQQPIPGR